MNSSDKAARVFKALGDPTRLRILWLLAECDSPVLVDQDGSARRVNGITVGEVCCKISGQDRPSSTLSHHIRELTMAGLIEVRKEGQRRICSVSSETIAELEAYVRRLVERSNEACCPAE